MPNAPIESLRVTLAPSQSARAIRDAAEDTYDWYVINSTDFTIKQVSITSPKGPWQDLVTPVGRTCSYPNNCNDQDNAQKCAREGKYALFLVSQCNQTLNIYVHLQALDGSWWTAGWENQYADCANYRGALLWLCA